MTADILATVATSLAIVGYLELRLWKQINTKLDQFTERYIHHLESHAK